MYWLEVATAIATVAAVVVAVWSSWRAHEEIRRDREADWLRHRHSEAVALLEAFELVYGVDPATPPGEERSPDSIRLEYYARFVAQLRGSAEELPITRGTAFGHWPYGADDPDEHAHLKAAPALGDPEREEDLFMKMRGEIVGAIENIHRKLQGHRV